MEEQLNLGGVAASLNSSSQAPIEESPTLPASTEAPSIPTILDEYAAMDDYECAVCMNTLCEPVQTQYGHTIS